MEPAHGFYLAWTFNHNNILCIQIFTFKLEKVHGPPGPQLEISSKEGWKEHTLFGQKHTLLGSGVSRALTKKIYTLLFLHSQNPLAKNGTAWFGSENLETKIWGTDCVITVITGGYFHFHF